MEVVILATPWLVAHLCRNCWKCTFAEPAVRMELLLCHLQVKLLSVLSSLSKPQPMVALLEH